jgi:hypothetical protein
VPQGDQAQVAPDRGNDLEFILLIQVEAIKLDLKKKSDLASIVVFAAFRLHFPLVPSQKGALSAYFEAARQFVRWNHSRDVPPPAFVPKGMPRAIEVESLIKK